jgi:hypothetical protein
MTPARIAQMQAAITTLQAQGAEVTAAAVYRLVSGHRRAVQVYVKAWKERQQAADVLACLVAPASPPSPPMSRLLSLRGQVAQLDEDWRVLERTQQQLQQQRAQTHADFRNGLLEAARLTRRLRQAEAQAQSPVSMMQPDAAHQRAQLRADLTALVGDAEVQRVLADPHYQPWWLEG